MAVPAAAPRESSDRTLVLEGFLPYRLNVLATLASNALAQIYGDAFALPVTSWRVLATLGQYGIRTARDIGQHAVMHKSTVSRAVSILEERGLLMRRPNADDRREELLELTAEGRRVYAVLAPQALAFEDRLLSVLGPGEQAAFAAIVDKLTAHARSLAPQTE